MTSRNLIQLYGSSAIQSTLLNHLIRSHTWRVHLDLGDFHLTEDKCDDGDQIQDIDDSIADDIASAECTLWKLRLSQGKVGQRNQIQNGNLTISIDISGDEWAAADKRWR